MINQIICGKAEEILKQIPENRIDLTVTSPPYSKIRDYKGFSFDFETIAKELYRITKMGGIVCWVVNDQYENGGRNLESFKQALFLKETCGFLVHDVMIYEKGGLSYPSKNRYHQSYEFILVLSKGKIKTFNPIKDLPNKNAGKPAHWGKINYRQKDGSMMKIKKNYVTPEFGVRRNVWKYKTGKGNHTQDQIAFNHPALMPEFLAKDIILSFSKKNDIILDPFSGAGTTCKMAKLTERNFIGVEISEEYCKIAEQRLILCSETLT